MTGKDSNAVKGWTNYSSSGDTLFFANIPHLTQRQVEDFCLDFGSVKSVSIIAKNGVSKGYGFVKMASVADAKAVLEQGAGSVVQGRRIKIEYAGHHINPSHSHNELCPFEKERYCWKGDQCEFRHLKQESDLEVLLHPDAASPVDCFDFRKGHCYRQNCRFQHDKHQSPTAESHEGIKSSPPHGRYSKGGMMINDYHSRVSGRSRSRS